MLEVPLEDSADDLYEHAPCGYVSTQPDGTITRVNETLLRWTGRQRDALIGQRRFSDLLAGGGRIYHETHFAPLLEMQGTVREIAFELACADGRRLPVLVNAVLRRDAGGRAISTRIAIFDATDRQAYEQELLRARRRAEDDAARSALLAGMSGALERVHTIAERADRLAALLVPDVADEARVVPEGAAIATSPGVAALPLRAEGQPLGILVLDRTPSGREFDADTLEFLRDLAERAALLLENARRYEHEREIARLLQRSLLGGDLRPDPRYQLATRYLPAVETLQVGGDWHQGFPISGERLGIGVGDVVGRGIHAAAAMGQLRSAVHALGVAGLGPRGVLERLDSFVESFEAARYATLAYAEIELATGAMRFACAGHPPPVLLRAGGDAALLWEGRSAPFGAYRRSQPRAEAECELRPGDRVLLYTDGLVERRDRRLDDELDRLVTAFAGLRDAPVETVVQTLVTDMLGDVRRGDDVCLLCLELGAQPNAGMIDAP